MQFNSQTLWFEGQTEVPRHVTIHRFVHPSTVFVPDVTDPKTSDNCGTKSILRIRNHKLRGNRNQPSLDSWLLHIPTLPCVCVCVCVATVVRGKYTFLCLCLCVCTQNHHHQHQCSSSARILAIISIYAHTDTSIERLLAFGKHHHHHLG